MSNCRSCSYIECNSSVTLVLQCNSSVTLVLHCKMSVSDLLTLSILTNKAGEGLVQYSVLTPNMADDKYSS